MRQIYSETPDFANLTSYVADYQSPFFQKSKTAENRTLYYIIGYRQLFGYGLWGTVWRLLFVFGFVYCVALLLAHLAFYLGLARDIHLAEYTLPAKIIMPGFYIFFGFLFVAVGYLINRITTRKTRLQQS